MEIHSHRWDITPEEAVALQKEMAAQVQRTNGFELSAIRTVANLSAG